MRRTAADRQAEAARVQQITQEVLNSARNSRQDYTLYIYKTDRRTRSGERLFSTTVWRDQTDSTMQREVNELHLHHYPRGQFRMEFCPTMKTVRNIMTGKDIQISHDTPMCCDPSSERFWTM